MNNEKDLSTTYGQLQLEIVTMKFMILSLYQGLVSDKHKDLEEWEKDCKEATKKYLEEIKEESERTKNE